MTQRAANLSPAQFKALSLAALRVRGNICPTVGVHAAASDALVKALADKGFVQWDGEPWQSAPRINEAGRCAVCEPIS